MKPWILVVASLCGCARGGAPGDPLVDGNGSGGKDAALVDADETLEDADEPHVDAPPVQGGSLLLTEVVVTPSGGEFIEIANPNDVPYDLSTYYLTDSGNYFRISTGTTVDSTDFLVKFPAGSQIQPRAVVTVSIDTAANFQTAYGVAPTYSIASGTGTMEVISINGVASLTNAGELVVLFQWNGNSDLVRDADIMLVGVPTAANGIVDKSNVALDGPDGGNTTTAYKLDGRTMPTQASTPAQGKSTKRILLEAANEQQTGAGNGINGDDETTEVITTTWDSTFTAPTPGMLPPGLLP